MNYNSYVYKITFISGLYYIGSRKCNKRLPQDDFLVKYFSSSKEVKNRINNNEKYTGEILSLFNDYEEAYLFEQQLIYSHINDEKCINKKCYHNRKGFGIISASAKEKIGKKSKENWTNQEFKQNIINSQKESWTIERKQKHQKWLNEVRWTKEKKIQHSELMKGHKGSKKLKGIKKPKEFGKKISSALKGKQKSKEHRRNLSKSKCTKIEYQGYIYYGWKEFTRKTGISKYQFLNHVLLTTNDLKSL